LRRAKAEGPKCSDTQRSNFSVLTLSSACRISSRLNRTVSKARTLAARFEGTTGCDYEGLEEAAFDLVVNATSAGLVGELPALPSARKLFAPGALAYDMVYGRDTPFLSYARAAEVRTSDGAGMLVEQAAESFLVWRGVRPDTRPVLAALRQG